MRTGDKLGRLRRRRAPAGARLAWLMPRSRAVEDEGIDAPYSRLAKLMRRILPDRRVCSGWDAKVKDWVDH